MSHHIENGVWTETKFEVLENDPDQPLDLDGVEFPEEIHQHSLDSLAAVPSLRNDDVIKPV